MLANKEIQAQAKAVLKGHLGLAIGGLIIYMVILIVASAIPIVGWVGSFVIGGPLTVGIAMFFIKMVRKEQVDIPIIFEGLKNNFINNMVAYILMIVFIVLWSLLLIVPGIIAAFGYAMTFFILADNPAMSGYDALQKSKAMMKGKKGKLFCLYFRFFFWILLGCITFGLAFIYVGPYMYMAVARFYEDIKDESIAAEAAPKQVKAEAAPAAEEPKKEEGA
jgi:uncharacterized membrane protein